MAVINYELKNDCLHCIKVKFGEGAGDYYTIDIYNKDVTIYPLNERLTFSLVGTKKEQKDFKKNQIITKEKKNDWRF